MNAGALSDGDAGAFHGWSIDFVSRNGDAP